MLLLIFRFIIIFYFRFCLGRIGRITRAALADMAMTAMTRSVRPGGAGDHVDDPSHINQSKLQRLTSGKNG
jgi:hypothetical protein